MSLLSKIAAPGADPSAIQHVSTTTNITTGLSLSISRPFGVVEGDLLIAMITNDQNSDVTSSSNGWAQVNSSHPFSIMVRVVEPTEPVSYTFSQGVSSVWSGFIVAYRNAAFEAVGSGGFTDQINPTAESVTVNNNESVLLALFRSFSSLTFSQPSGFFEVVSRSSAQPAWSLFSRHNVSSGSSGATTSSTGVGFASSRGLHLVLRKAVYKQITFVGSSIQNTSGTTITAQTPTGTVQGDMMLAFAISSASSGSFSAPSGWSGVTLQVNSPPNMFIAYRVATASEPSSHQFTFNFSGTLVCSIVTYRGAVIDTGGSFTTGSANLDHFSTFATADFARLVGCVGKTGTGIAVPSSTIRNSRVSFSSGAALGVFDEIKPATFGYLRRLSASTTSGNHAANSVAIRPI